MKNNLYFLSVLSLFAAPALALQTTPASTVVRVGASVPGPVDSTLGRASIPTVYVPNSGDVVVMELESLPTTGSWVKETSLSGFGGDGYFRWNGPNLFGTPGVDILTYRFEVKTTDDYYVRMHVRHDDPDPSEENDCWARIDGGPWEKLFHNNGPGGVGSWSFNGRYESTGGFPQHVLSAGEHTWEISGRSHNFKIDRIHVLPVSTFFAKLSDPQSDIQRSRPIIGQTFSVGIDDPTNSAGMTPGLAKTAYYGAVPGPGYPNGIVINIGELFLTAPGGTVRLAGFQTWQGPGIPNFRNLPVPNDLSLVGRTFITQGLMFEPGKFVLTNGLEVNFGDI